MQALSDLLAARTLAVTDEAGTLDRQAFLARVAGLATQLQGVGVTAGSRVGLWLPNSADHLAVIFALAQSSDWQYRNCQQAAGLPQINVYDIIMRNV